jgi:hypothetical protein
MSCFFTIYSINIPANTEAISPENLLKKFYPNFDADKFIKLQKERLSAAQ